MATDPPMSLRSGSDLVRWILDCPQDGAGTLIRLADKTEWDWLEFKASLQPGEEGFKKDKDKRIENEDNYRWNLAEAVIAMANTRGGAVLLGVDDDGQPIGLHASDANDRIQGTKTDKFIREVVTRALEGKEGIWEPLTKSGGLVITCDKKLTSLCEFRPETLGGVPILVILVNAVPVEGGLIPVLEWAKQDRKKREVVFKRQIGKVGQIDSLIQMEERQEWQACRTGHLRDIDSLFKRFQSEHPELGVSPVPSHADSAKARAGSFEAAGVLPAVHDFGSYRTEKHRDYCDRPRLREDLLTMVTSPAERTLLITGPLGSGKTAFLADFVDRNPGGRVLAYHFCVFDTSDTLKPPFFVRNMASMLAQRLPGYAAALEDRTTIEALREENCQADAATAFTRGILEPLHHLQPPDEDVYYILVDSLDEAMLSGDPGPNIVNILAPCVERLPSWMRLVITTRPLPEIMHRFSRVRRLSIDPADRDPRVDTHTDIETYVRARLETPNSQAWLQHSRTTVDKAVKIVLAKSEANFLYVRLLFEAMDRELPGFDLDALPLGFDGLLTANFDRCFEHRKSDYEPARRLLQVMLAAREPADETLLAKATGLDPDSAISDALETLSDFVRVKEDDAGMERYSFVHQALAEWLRDRKRARRYYTNPKKGDRQLAEMCWSEFDHDPQSVSPYCLRYMVRHLIASEQQDRLTTLLTNLPYLELRNSAGQMFDLASDFAASVESLPAGCPQRRILRLLGEALRCDIHFIARHAGDYPQALFQCLWNSCWWYDCDNAKHYYQPGNRTRHTECTPREGPKEPRLSTLLERWRRECEERYPNAHWVRSLLPPPTSLGSAQRVVLRPLPPLHPEDSHFKHPDDLGVTSVKFSHNGDRIVGITGERYIHWWDSNGDNIWPEPAYWRYPQGPGDAYLMDVIGVSKDTPWKLIRNLPHTSEQLPDDWPYRGGQSEPDSLCVVYGGNGSEETSEYAAGIICARFSPEGGWVAVSLDDGTLWRWDWADKKEPVPLGMPQGVARDLLFSHDGSRIAFTLDDGTLRVWDADNREKLAASPPLPEEVTTISLSSEGDWVAIGASDGTVAVWNVASREGWRGLDRLPAEVTSVSCCPDPAQRRIASGSADGAVRLWDASGKERPDILGWHEGRVHCVSYSFDGKRIVSGSADGTARVWDASRSAEQAVPRSPNGAVLHVSISPNEERIAGVVDDGTIWIWDGTGCSAPVVLDKQSGKADKVCFSPDAERLVSASTDGTLWLWNTTCGGTPIELPGEKGQTLQLRYSPDGKRIAAASSHEASEEIVRVWDASGPEQPAVLRGRQRQMRIGGFSPDGERIATISWQESFDGIVRVWDAANADASIELSGHEGWAPIVQFSPDGKRIATGSDDGTVRLWSADDEKPWTLIAVLPHEDKILTIGFSPDGKTVATGSADKTMRLWDAADGRPLAEPRCHESPVTAVAFSLDGSRIASGSEDGTIRVWDGGAEKEATVHLGRHEKEVTSVLFFPNGERIISGAKDGTVKTWDAVRGDRWIVPKDVRHQVVFSLEIGYIWPPKVQPSCISLSPDGNCIFVAARPPVLIRNAASDEWQVEYLHGQFSRGGLSEDGEVLGDVCSVSFSPDGRRLVTGGEWGAIVVWDTVSGDKLIPPFGHKQRVCSVCFSPDGRRIATGSEDKTVRLWDAADGKELAVLRGHRGAVSSVSFSPDGSHIVSGTRGDVYDSTVQIWDAATGVELVSIPHSDKVDSTSFSPDGKRLVTLCDGIATVWDAQSGTRGISIPRGAAVDKEFVYSVCFSADGKEIVAGVGTLDWGPDRASDGVVIDFTVGWYDVLCEESPPHYCHLSKTLREHLRDVYSGHSLVGFTLLTADDVVGLAAGVRPSYYAVPTSEGPDETVVEDFPAGYSVAWFPAALATHPARVEEYSQSSSSRNSRILQVGQTWAAPCCDWRVSSFFHAITLERFPSLSEM